MNEFFPPKDVMQGRIDKENEVNRLEKLAGIGARLIEEKLKDKDDELEDHLVLQLDRIMESQNLQNIEIARELVVIGYEIDTALEQGIGIGETLLGSIEELTQMVIALLQDEFPKVSKDEAGLVIGRMIDKYNGGYFADTLLEMINERRETMRKMVSSNYIVDNSTGVAELIIPKK